MRYGIGVVVGLVFLAGCSSPKAPPSAPHDVMTAMKTELAHSFAQLDAFDAMDDELSHAIGTTTLTSATIAPEAPAAPEPKPMVTWGVSPASDEQPEEIATTRE